MAKGTILEAIWDQKGTPQKGVTVQAPGVHGRFGFQLLNKALEPKMAVNSWLFLDRNPKAHINSWNPKWP